jgi:phage protein D
MTPVARLIVDGVDLTWRLSPRLNALSLSEKRGGEADQLEFTIDDSDGSVALPRKGVTVTLSMGYDNATGTAPLFSKGTFKVDDYDWTGGPDTITIRARATDFTGGISVRRDGSWRDTTLGAVVGELASRNGLEPRIAGDLATIALPLVAQSRESDLALLRRLGHAHDAVATIKAGRLVFARIGAGVTASGAAIPSATITRAAGDRPNFRSADRDSAEGSGAAATPRGVRARWRSTASAATHTVLVGPSTGARRLPRIYATEDAATRAAQAAYDRRSRKKAEFTITLATGRPELYPERQVTLQGFKAGIDGSNWLISEVRHQLGGGGFTTDLTLQTL